MVRAFLSPKLGGARLFAASAMAIGVLLGAVGVATSSASSAAESKAVPTVSTKDVRASADAFPREDAPTTTTGELNWITSSGQLGDRKRIYLQFEVKGLVAGSKVASSALTLQPLNNGPAFEVYPVNDRHWEESTISWNAQPWWQKESRLATSKATSKGEPVDIDLGQFVNGNGTYELAIVVPRSVDGDAVFASRESAKSPQLRLSVQGPAPSKTLFGASISSASDFDRLNSPAYMNGSMQVVRRFYQKAPPAKWSDDRILATVKSDTAVVLSFKTGTPEQIKSFLLSRPSGVKVWMSYFHEPEDNFTTSEQQRAYRMKWKSYAPAIREGNAIPTLTLMRWTLSDGSGRDWRNYFEPGSVDLLSWDAYNSGWKANPQTYKDPAAIVGPILAVAKETNLPWAISETGSPIIGSSTARANWAGSLADAYAMNGAVFAIWWDAKTANFDSLMDPATAQAWQH